MRHLVVSLVLTLSLAGAAPGFEIEDHRRFEGAAATAELRVISTTDIGPVAPVIEAFLADNPTVAVDYTVASSAELMRALYEEGAAFDIAVSSAMDLQTKLANDGLALPHESAATQLLPDWGRWRDHVFAFTQEPATIVISNAAFDGLEHPRTRQELITLLRDNPDRFQGRVGTYDVRSSGLGYLFATQDARTSETFWRLAEVMGALDIRLYCCSSDMIDDVISGRIAVAYNVLGTYAAARADAGGSLSIITPQDFTTVMLRTVLIPRTSPEPELAARFVDHLIRSSQVGGGQPNHPFPGIDPEALSTDTALRPIRLGPGLLVYLDQFKKQSFIREWESAILQP